MASLLARHSKTCEHGRPWSRVDYTARSFRPQKEELGCTCNPRFYVVAAANGAGGRRSVGSNFDVAKEVLTKTQGGLDRGEDVTVRNVVFEAWADEWFGSLRRPNANTLRSYVSTLDYAKRAFGRKRVRDVKTSDLEHFFALMKRERVIEGKKVEEPVSPTTMRKHLRVLSSCFKEAARQGYTATNPVTLLGESHRPQAKRRESAYFTNDELPRLLAALEEPDRSFVHFALLTGMRLGEIIALTWKHVDLLAATVTVRQAYTDGLGVVEPKSDKSKRTVRLTSQAVELLGSLWSENETEDAIVFPPVNPTLDGYRRGYDIPRHVLYPALKRAGIERVGPTGEERTFHSLRHTYARLVLEAGASIEWLSRQMGHSSTAVTQNVYGHWSDEAAQREIARLEEAATFSF